MKKITSIQNSYIKQLLQLQEKSRVRKQSGTFLIEGLREITLAVKGGYSLKTILFVPGIINTPQISSIINNSIECIQITHDVYKKLAYRDTTEGVLAVAVSKELSLDNLKLNKNPLVLVAEAPEKPGNIGALLRTADAASLDAVIIANPKGDLYNPNIIRSSVGCLFTTTIATGTTNEVITFLNKNSISIYAATLQNATAYHEQIYTHPTALVLGTEATGLSQEWRDAAKQNIMIPMQGEIDSMNVSVAAAVLIFEAKRQRGFKI